MVQKIFQRHPDLCPPQSERESSVVNGDLQRNRLQHALIIPTPLSTGKLPLGKHVTTFLCLCPTSLWATRHPSAPPGGPGPAVLRVPCPLDWLFPDPIALQVYIACLPHSTIDLLRRVLCRTPGATLIMLAHPERKWMDTWDSLQSPGCGNCWISASPCDRIPKVYLDTPMQIGSSYPLYPQLFPSLP